MARKRKRARASDIAPKSSFNTANFFIFLAVLILLLAGRHLAGERTAGFIESLTGGGESLPKASVLSTLEAGVDGGARPDAAPSP